MVRSAEGGRHRTSDNRGGVLRSSFKWASISSVTVLTVSTLAGCGGGTKTPAAGGTAPGVTTSTIKTPAAGGTAPGVTTSTVKPPAAGGTAPGVTTSTIKIGIMSDLTGIAASTFDDTPQAMEARFKQINAEGGIEGRQITWVVDDTTSSPAGALTAAKDLVENKGVFAIAELSGFFSAAAPFLNQAGIPVTGSSLDGPEWFEQPNTNLFSFTGNGTAKGAAYSDGGFWKAIGATKISYVEANAPSAISEGNSVYDSILADGLQPCDKTVVPIGGVNFTAFALSFKKEGCDTAESANVLSSSLAMATVLKQADVPNLKIVFAAGPSESILTNPQEEMAAEGAYFSGVGSSPTYDNAAGQAFLANLRLYDTAYKGGVPDLAEGDGWPVADLMVKGLQVAGSDPTRQSFITNLRNVTDWTDSGLAAAPINFVHFGQNPPEQCFTYVQLVNGKYVAFPSDGKPFCGTIMPGTTT
jgi:branched-chain amino acid transport system substrate-binding protein